MKKIMFLFLMVMGLLSSLYASPPNLEDTLKINAGQENVSTNVNVVVAADVDKEVVIYHKDTLMYSWGECDNKKIMKINGSKQNANIDLNSIAMAVVGRPHGVYGR